MKKLVSKSSSTLSVLLLLLTPAAQLSVQTDCSDLKLGFVVQLASKSHPERFKVYLHNNSRQTVNIRASEFDFEWVIDESLGSGHWDRVWSGGIGPGTPGETGLQSAPVEQPFTEMRSGTAYPLQTYSLMDDPQIPASMTLGRLYRISFRQGITYKEGTKQFTCRVESKWHEFVFRRATSHPPP
jgi:hypothetical protein